MWANQAPLDTFPLLVRHLCDNEALFLDMRVEALTGHKFCDTCAISLEIVHRVENGNILQRPRIDYFVYFQQGHIVRCHPGSCTKQDAKPHVMTNNTCLLLREHLPRVGAGQCLHRVPPGTVANRCAPQPPAGYDNGQYFALDFDLSKTVCGYDAKSYGWSTARKFLETCQCPAESTIALTDGELWPWWLWMSNTGKIASVTGEGIRSFEIQRLPSMKAFRVVTAVDTHYVFPKSGISKDMMIRTAAQMRTEGLL